MSAVICKKNSENKMVEIGHLINIVKFNFVPVLGY